MPDVHVGYGVPIGYTQTIKDTVVPNFVGVDIGCGLLVSKLSNEKDYQINFHKLDNEIKRGVPSGFNIHKRRQHVETDIESIIAKINVDWAYKSLGTLGGGNHFIEVNRSEEVRNDVEELERKGNSIVITAIDNNIEIAIGIKDQIRPNVKEEISRMKKLGVKELILLSGDNQGTVDLVASELGLTKAYGNMLPEDKANYIKELQKQKKIVAFVGDGVNDSPSLALANIGIAMGTGTDVAIETSDVVLMNSDFSKLTHALGLTKKTTNNMKQNIFIAVGTVIVLLTSLLFGDWMNMSIGMLVHEASILVVILNGMRLINYKLKRRE